MSAFGEERCAALEAQAMSCSRSFGIWHGDGRLLLEAPKIRSEASSNNENGTSGQREARRKAKPKQCSFSDADGNRWSGYRAYMIEDATSAVGA